MTDEDIRRTKGEVLLQINDTSKQFALARKALMETGKRFEKLGRKLAAQQLTYEALSADDLYFLNVDRLASLIQEVNELSAKLDTLHKEKGELGI